MSVSTVCTICSYNYLSFAVNCCLSVKEHNRSIDTYILIVDKHDSDIKLLGADVINYIYLDDLFINKEILIDMEFKYSIVEMNTAIKPAFILYLMSKGYMNVMYLDPDTMCFNSLEYIVDKLKSYDVILTPHKITPINSLLIDDSAFLNNGLYNLGFCAIRNTDRAEKILHWWMEKLEAQAFLDYSKGLATDQIWANFFPLFFDDVFISKHYGMNVAFWNIEERNISKKDDIYYVNDDKLLFFHFSGFVLNKKIILKNVNNVLDYPFLGELYNQYNNNVLSNNYSYFSTIKYAYNYYENGMSILPLHRRLYAELKPYVDFGINPFSVSKGSFYYSFVKKDGKISFPKKTKLHNNSKYFFLKIFIFLFGIKKIFWIINQASRLSVQAIAKLYCQR
jgi:hypothetical protein